MDCKANRVVDLRMGLNFTEEISFFFEPQISFVKPADFRE
jgi:hypothetical protein